MLRRPPTIDERFRQIEALLAELRAEVGTLPRPARDSPDAEAAVTAWLNGVAWDETFTRDQIEDEFGVIERRVRVALREEEKSRMLELWKELRASRYPASVAA